MLVGYVNESRSRPKFGTLSWFILTDPSNNLPKRSSVSTLSESSRLGSILISICGLFQTTITWLYRISETIVKTLTEYWFTRYRMQPSWRPCLASTSANDLPCLKQVKSRQLTSHVHDPYWLSRNGSHECSCFWWNFSQKHLRKHELWTSCWCRQCCKGFFNVFHVCLQWVLFISLKFARRNLLNTLEGLVSKQDPVLFAWFSEFWKHTIYADRQEVFSVLYTPVNCCNFISVLKQSNAVVNSLCA